MWSDEYGVVTDSLLFPWGFSAETKAFLCPCWWIEGPGLPGYNAGSVKLEELSGRAETVGLKKQKGVTQAYKGLLTGES